MKILIAPHNDDEALFASYIIQRFKPWVIICLDGNQHERKFGLKIQERCNESRAAMTLLGVQVSFLHVSDENPTVEKIVDKLYKRMGHNCDESIGDLIFAPTKSGGNMQHDMVSDAVKYVFADPIYYSTYTKDKLFPQGEIALLPTPEEEQRKANALACYTSQLRINPHHFAAVQGVPEYLNANQ